GHTPDSALGSGFSRIPGGPTMSRLENVNTKTRRARRFTKRSFLIPLSLSGFVVSLASSGALAQAPAPSPLPVRQVTLFSSGVSYTERSGEVDGDATVPILFRTGQINDILKSMVLLDEGGHVQPASYAARDPISHTLQSF